jgi:hypothetical protein
LPVALLPLSMVSNIINLLSFLRNTKEITITY